MGMMRPMSRGLSRRRFLQSASLAGVGALGSSGLLTSCASVDRFFGFDASEAQNEVLIIGAGLAGLVAAHELKRKKIPYRIVEASERFGGRVQTLYSFNSDNQFAEMGGEIVDGRYQAFFDLCSELNIPLDRLDDSKGNFFPMFWSGGRFVPNKELIKETQPILSKLIEQRLTLTGDEQEASASFRRDASAALFDLDRFSLADLVKRVAPNASPRAVQFFKSAARAQFGAEAEEQSCLHFLASLDPEIRRPGVYRVQGGTQVLTQSLYSRVAGVIPDFFVKFKTQATLIQRTEKGLRVQTKSAAGTRWMEAKAVIVAVPPSALRKITGWEQSPLSAEGRAAIKGWTMGTHSKTVLSYDEKFWAGGPQWLGDFDLQSLWESSRGQVGRSGLLTFSTAGKDGAVLGANAFERAAKTLADLWGRKVTPSQMQMQNWSQMKYAEGSMTVFAPTTFSKWNGIFQDPVGDWPLYFAGEHVSPLYTGTMEAAVASGKQAAQKAMGYLTAASS